MEGLAIDTKQEIRQKALFCRSAIPETDRVRASQVIQQRIKELPEYVQGQRIMFFASFGDEVRLWGAIEQAWKDSKIVLLPRTVKATGELEIYHVNEMKNLIPGQWGILEPDPNTCPRIKPEEVDLVILPGVAFDYEGNRVGYGKGYYDRLLPQMRSNVKRIAVAFQCQLFPEVPTEEHDEKLHALITEETIVRFP